MESKSRALVAENDVLKPRHNRAIHLPHSVGDIGLDIEERNDRIPHPTPPLIRSLRASPDEARVGPSPFPAG
jgi:hypothetical protein